MVARRVFVLIALCGSHVARAEPEPTHDAWTRPHVAGGVHLGVGGPLGMLGFELEATPVAWLSVAAGYGTNRGFTPSFGGSSSYSIAGAVRAHVPVASGWNIVPSLGASHGNWDVEDHPLGESPYGEAKWSSVSWVDLDFGIEHRWRHLVLRAYLGRSLVVAKHGYSCQDFRNAGGECPYMLSSPGDNGYLGVALSYAFSL